MVGRFVFFQVYVDKKAYAQCMKDTFEADVLKLVAAKAPKDAQYAKKLLHELQLVLLKKDEHVFFGVSSHSRMREILGVDHAVVDEGKWDASVLAEVRNDLSDLGWEEEEWSCSEFFYHIGKFHCSHCLYGIEPISGLCY